MDYALPRTVYIGGEEYAVRYDFRCILDICAALEDPDLEPRDKAAVALEIFYPDLDSIPSEFHLEAVEKCYWFINGGEMDTGHKGPVLVSWEKDVKQIISPINKIIGKEIRDIPYNEETNTGGLHWWTFLAAYTEIGDCFFAQIVRIRSLLKRGKKLDKQDAEFYKNNKERIDLKRKRTAEENAVIENIKRYL